MALLPEGQVRQATGSKKAHSWSDIGTGLYPSGALFNHSCAPTCMWFVDQGVLVVETLQAVKKNEELSIAYLPVSRSCDAERGGRQRRLRDQFGFTCACVRCSEEGAVVRGGEVPRKRPAAAPARTSEPAAEVDFT